MKKIGSNTETGLTGAANRVDRLADLVSNTTCNRYYMHFHIFRNNPRISVITHKRKHDTRIA
jgi:hypothetical protein